METGEMAREERLVAFIGRYSCGKSTLLNALMRRNIFYTGISPIPGIPSQVVFGGEEGITVVKREADPFTGRQVREDVSAEAYRAYPYTEPDERSPFYDMDYVILRQPGESVFGGDVRLMEIPLCFDDDAASTCRQFIRAASAVVFVVDAAKPFSLDEKAYIKTHFAGKHLTDLFFVINRFDCVNDDLIEPLKADVRKHLEAVYTDGDEVFDEKLFNSRVFYTNAYGSLAARCPEVKNRYPVPDSETGVPELEAALDRVLNGGHKAEPDDIYKRAAAWTARNGLAKQAQEQEKLFTRAASIAQHIARVCQESARRLSKELEQVYEDFLRDAETNWDGTVPGRCPRLTIGQLTVLAISHDEARKNEMIAPIVTAVEGYVIERAKHLENRLDDITAHVLDQTDREIGACQEELDSLRPGLDVYAAIKERYGPSARSMADMIRKRALCAGEVYILAPPADPVPQLVFHALSSLIQGPAGGQGVSWNARFWFAMKQDVITALRELEGDFLQRCQKVCDEIADGGRAMADGILAAMRED